MTLRPPRKRVSFDVTKVLEDMASHGWNATATAKAARVSEATMSRFLAGENQSPKTAAAIATALGRSPRDYVIIHEEEARAS